mmetsp:Transcript_46675/g.72739  ORF Transcript_46675/g.72739 Transcript_46675/m.72739 type:complete len:235 (-) Transcript_46675:334-1038(-)
MITTDVQIGSAPQQALISDRSSDFSTLVKVLALKNNARAAVVMLQLPLHSFISATTCWIKSLRKALRNSGGLCHISKKSSSTRQSSPSILISPQSINLLDLLSILTKSSASCKPAIPRVLSTTRTPQISCVSCGQIAANSLASCVPAAILCGGPNTTIKWPMNPPAVPISAKPPPEPATYSTSPGAMSCASLSSLILRRRMQCFTRKPAEEARDNLEPGAGRESLLQRGAALSI